MTHMDVIDGYLASNRISYSRFDNMIGTRHGLTQQVVSGTHQLKPSVALRIEQVTGLDAADLLCRQAKVQLEQLRQKDTEQPPHPLLDWLNKQSGWARDETAINAWNAAIEHALKFVIPDGNPIIAKAKIEQLLYKNGESS